MVAYNNNKRREQARRRRKSKRRLKTKVIRKALLIGKVGECFVCGKKTGLDEAAGCRGTLEATEHIISICDECYETPIARDTAEEKLRQGRYSRVKEGITFENYEE